VCGRPGIAVERNADEDLGGQRLIGAELPLGADPSARDVEDLLANASIPERILSVSRGLFERLAGASGGPTSSAVVVWGVGPGVTSPKSRPLGM